MISRNSSGNYGNVGLDLKRHMDDQSVGSPSSTGDLDSLQEPEVKRPRQDQPKYETE